MDPFKCTGCIFRENVSPSYGSAIDNYRGYITLEDCDFIENSNPKYNYKGCYKDCGGGGRDMSHYDGVKTLKECYERAVERGDLFEYSTSYHCL